MPSIGEQLRTARLRRGLELEELSSRTKIPRKFLAAIEADDRQQLPAGFFYRSWVQQYALELSLEVPRLMEDVERVLSADSPPALPGQQPAAAREARLAPVPIPSSGTRWGQSVILLLIVVGSGSGVYAWWRQSARPPVNHADGRVTNVTAPARGPEVAVKPVSAAPGWRDPEVAEAASPNPATAQPPIGDPSGEVRLEITATEPTWVSITPDGKQAFAGVLEATQVKTVAAREGARIRVGNAGGLQVRLNGKPIGPVGPAGQVRTLVVNKDGYQVLNPAPIVEDDEH
jgi:cytoskeleton protein RodZ